MRAYGIEGIGKSLHLAVSQSFVALLFILVDFIFSKQLSVAEFGVWKEIFFFFNLGIPLLAFGLPEGYKYFIAKEDNIAGFLKSLTGVLLLVCLSLFIVLGLLNLLHYFNHINLGSYYLLSLLFPLPLLAFILNKALRYTYINTNEAERLTKLSVFGAVASIVIIILGYVLLKNHIEWFSFIAVAIYFSIFVFPALFYMKGLSPELFGVKIQKQDLKKMLTYGLPLYLAAFAGLLSLYLDKLIVNFATDDTTFAIFVVGAFEVPIFAMLSAAFSQQIFPRMVKHVEEREESKAKNLWILTSKKVSLITYPFILVVMFFAKEIIYFIYSSEYAGSVILFKTYLLVALFRNNSYGILLTAKGKTKIITNIAVAILFINLILSLLLFRFYGLNGIVFGTLISTVIFTTYILIKERLLGSYFKQVLGDKKVALFTVLILITYFFF